MFHNTHEDAFTQVRTSTSRHYVIDIAAHGENHSPLWAHQVSCVVRFVCVVVIGTTVLFTQVSRHAAQRGHRNDVCINITGMD
jgi:hypothetical protein